MVNLTLKQRQALGNLMEVFQENGPAEWKEFVAENFADWQPITSSGIDVGDYFSALRTLHSDVKTGIIGVVLYGWNTHHNWSLFYDLINKCIYLKLCGAVEYFLVQQVFNFMEYFSSVCKSAEQIHLQLKRNAITIRFHKEGEKPMFGDSYGLLDFELPPVGDSTKFLAIAPWFDLMKVKLGLPESHEFTDAEIDRIMGNDYLPLLRNEFAKRHCPWIYSSFEYGCRFVKTNPNLCIAMVCLEYVDNNGL